MKTPLLLMIFNRPETTQKVFEVIRSVRPIRLFIAADGPRKGIPGDVEKCEETLSVVKKIDWDCEVKTLFRAENVGCRKGPITSINWFFDNVDEGIILEDDCVPQKSFFPYCSELLDRYRHDERIMHISGNNFFPGMQRDGEYSYYFSYYANNWGWATWKRAWDLFNVSKETYEEIKNKNCFEDIFKHKRESSYILRILERLYSDNFDVWDYQWIFSRLINHGLSIVPNANLVFNIGFGCDATHTKNRVKKYELIKTSEMIFPMRHPKYCVRDSRADYEYLRKYLEPSVFVKTISGIKQALLGKK